MSHFSWTFSPPWRWVAYEWTPSTDTWRTVPERRPYWATEFWTMPWDEGPRPFYWHVRIAGLEMSGKFG